MREILLKRFFEGLATARELAADVAGSKKRASDKQFQIAIEDMEGSFTVIRSHLLMLCDAVISGELPPEALEAVGFAVISSDTFDYDADEDELVANVIADWSCPEVNYPLTKENTEHVRKWLAGEEAYPAKPPLRQQSQSNIISFTEKRMILSLGKRLRRALEQCRVRAKS